MNKEQKKFSKVIKARRLHKRHIRRTKNKFGLKLPLPEWPLYKSKKFKEKIKKHKK